MRRLMAAIVLMLVIVCCVTACAGSDVSAVNRKTDQAIRPEKTMKEQETTAGSSGDTGVDTARQEQTEYIGTVPDACFANAKQQGQVSEIRYGSRDYTADDEPAIEKTAYIYLPYGYDEDDSETRYDILYLMHGWTMTAGDFFQDPQSGIVNMLDHMIQSGDIPPVIVVCATFDAQNQPQNFSRSVEELSVFHRDLRENLIPAVESRFHTYAATAGLWELTAACIIRKKRWIIWKICWNPEDGRKRISGFSRESAPAIRSGIRRTARFRRCL